jgi:hypothetical protein
MISNLLINTVAPELGNYSLVIYKYFAPTALRKIPTESIFKNSANAGGVPDILNDTMERR